MHLSQMTSGIVYYKMSSKKEHQFAANICVILENVTIVNSKCGFTPAQLSILELQPNS